MFGLDYPIYTLNLDQIDFCSSINFEFLFYNSNHVYHLVNYNVRMYYDPFDNKNQKSFDKISRNMFIFVYINLPIGDIAVYQ